MKRNIAYILGIMLLAASCIGEQELDVNSTRKDEVKFAAEMKSVDTKTLYGADNANTIKVKWVNGDQIKVFGTHCAVPTGEYKISEAANLPNVDGSQEESIADELVRIGDVGVQWGTEQQSDFVAIYPAENSSFQYNEDNGAVTVSTTISSVQNYVFDDEVNSSKTIVVNVYDDNGNKAGTKSIPVWEGTHFANDATNPTMPNAIMYARTDGVTNGKNVALKFEPFTTVLKFRFEGFSDLWDKGTEVYIQSITLEAPSAIAGDFDITVPRGVSETNPVTAVKTGNNSNSITINTIKAGGSYLKITADQAVEFNIFTLPLANMTISETALWTVSIQVQGVAAPYTYKMKPTKDGGYQLVPGLIHKVKIPALKITTPPVWTPGNWITQIPKPVYVSELSVPGAWYCTNADYQSTTSLQTQYSNGIRAFNIDCRLTYESGRSGDMVLCCAGSENSLLGYITSPGKTVLSALQEIAGLVPADEYVVVVLTIAEKPKSDSGRDLGTIDPSAVLAAIAELLTDNGKSLGVYGYTDKTSGKIINPDTTIEDVLDHMIVKVNVNTTPTKFLKYSSLPNTMLSFASMAPETSGDIVMGTFDVMQNSPIYWGTKDAKLQYYYHQAQRTTYSGTYINTNWYGGSQEMSAEVEGVPTYEDRIAAINSVIQTSKSVYDAAEHNVWFQLGIGGSRKNNQQDDDYASQVEVGQRLNPYLYGKIIEKMDTDPSPVGIVLMNHATDNQPHEYGGYTASSQDLVKAIIEMNGKFYLNRKGNDVVTGGGEQNGADSGNETRSAAYVGPDAF